MKRPSTTAPCAPSPIDPNKEQRLRRWACKIASELPSGGDDALQVLKLAEGLISWADRDDPPSPPRRKGARAAK